MPAPATRADGTVPLKPFEKGILKKSKLPFPRRVKTPKIRRSKTDGSFKLSSQQMKRTNTLTTQYSLQSS